MQFLPSKMGRRRVEGLKATVDEFDKAKREAESVRTDVSRSLEHRPFWPERRARPRDDAAPAEALPAEKP